MLKSNRDLGRVFLFWFAALVILLVFGFLRGMLPPAAGPLAWGVCSSLALFLLVRWFVRADGRTLADAGLRWNLASPLRVLVGFVIGLATYAGAVMMASLAVGPLQVAAADRPTGSAVMLAVFSTTALVLMEELALRSYSLWTAVRALGAWRAQLLVAVAFALLHVGYGWPLQTVLLGVFPSALLFGVGAMISGGLAVPIGIHLGMNIGRWAAGERGSAGFLVIDAQGANGTHAALAPFLAALAPLVMAAMLQLFTRRRGSPRVGKASLEASDE